MAMLAYKYKVIFKNYFRPKRRFTLQVLILKLDILLASD